MKIIKKMSAKETYFVRNNVLRKGKPIESCHFDGDDLETTVHFGLYDHENCVGIVSVFQNKNDNFDHSNQFQIRGMAVLDNFQKKGVGQMLIKHCENYLYSNNKVLIWFNARENAVNFYKKMNYQCFGKSFLIYEIGIHYIMYKELG